MKQRHVHYLCRQKLLPNSLTLKDGNLMKCRVMDDDSVKLPGTSYLRIMVITPNYWTAENIESVYFQIHIFRHKPSPFLMQGKGDKSKYLI